LISLGQQQQKKRGVPAKLRFSAQLEHGASPADVAASGSGKTPMPECRRSFAVAGSGELAAAAGSRARAQSPEARRKIMIDALLQHAVEAGDVPGVVAMVTDRTQTLYEGAFGKRALGQPTEMTLDAVVWIASMTKPLTAFAAMQLVEQGRLELDPQLPRSSPTLPPSRFWKASTPPATPSPDRPGARSHCVTFSLTPLASATSSGAATS
jgi:Beta-lactamase